MIIRRALVLDANILIRAVLGQRVRGILRKYHEVARFYSPEICFQEAAEHLPIIVGEEGAGEAPILEVLHKIHDFVDSVDQSLYAEFESLAKRRVSSRDPDDWPVVATALFLQCPIWTEDKDFFGSGIATWTTDRVELFLAGD